MLPPDARFPPLGPRRRFGPAAGAAYASMKGTSSSRPSGTEATKGRENAMSQGLQAASESFVDRRIHDFAVGPPAVERRQFSNTHEHLSPEARELGTAIDNYKMRHRRRFINYEEMLDVILSLGYRK
jgi:hypothetical protein